jgi:hypothetical protein
MSIVDRVMRAYVSKHDLSPAQATFVRAELSKFIDELMGRPVQASIAAPRTETSSPGDQTLEPQTPAEAESPESLKI